VIGAVESYSTGTGMRRTSLLFAAMHESGSGTKRTSGNVRSTVANGGKADVAQIAHFDSD
jgi:hypothetical protein